MFRESCTHLRKKIFTYAQTVGNERRVLNVEKWAEEAIMVWKSLQQSDDFVKIQSLKYIEDHRKLLQALEIYEKIMTNSEEMFP